MFSIHDAKVQHSASPNSRNVMNRHELASYCELFIHRPLFVHRLSQINTDFLFRHGIPRLFFKRHGLAPHHFNFLIF